MVKINPSRPPEKAPPSVTTPQAFAAARAQSVVPTPEQFFDKMNERAVQNHAQQTVQQAAPRQQPAKAAPQPKAVATRSPNTGIALTQEEMSWGNQIVDASDIIVPRLYIINGTSKLAKEDPKTYLSGSIVRSTDKRILEDLQFVPFRYMKKWKIEVRGKSKFDHVRFEPFTPENATRPWEWVDKGQEYRANITVEFFVLMKDDIEREKAAFSSLEDGEYPDPDDVLLPTCISFSRSTYQQGKLLLSHFAKAQSMKLNPAVSMFTLKPELYTNPENSWYGLAIEKVGKSQAEDILLAKKWYDMFDTANIVVDDSEEDVSHQSQPAASSNENFSTEF